MKTDKHFMIDAAQVNLDEIDPWNAGAG